MPATDRPARVALTGGSGLLGRAIQRAAPSHDGLTLLAPARGELDLSSREQVAQWLSDHRIDTVIHAAAKVGGIQANTDDPTGFLAENLRINDSTIMGAFQAGIRRLVFIASSCIYPRNYRQPLLETDLLAAPLEPTNQGYALAKITGAEMCRAISTQFPGRAYRTLVPCNLFGCDDHFDSAASHLIAAIITKIVRAERANTPEVQIWGTGQARREFLPADTLASFILDILHRLPDLPQILNTGQGQDHSVNDFYRMIADIAGWRGHFTHDLTRPEGMAHKLIDSSLAHRHGWRPPADLRPALTDALTAARKML